MKRIAFFDFDGTITTKDTLLEFIKFSKGRPAFYLGFALNLPYLLAYKTGIISNQSAKEKILAWFFRGNTTAQFENSCRQFAAKIIPSLVRDGAHKELEKLRNSGTEIVIVTASAESWVKPWTDQIGAAILGTRLEIIDGKLTGKLDKINCHGDEKVKRIREAYSLDQYAKIIAYGDTSGDKPMLAIAQESHYKPFRD